jgi:hypothetical protein
MMRVVRRERQEMTSRTGKIVNLTPHPFSSFSSGIIIMSCTNTFCFQRSRIVSASTVSVHSVKHYLYFERLQLHTQFRQTLWQDLNLGLMGVCT